MSSASEQPGAANEPVRGQPPQPEGVQGGAGMADPDAPAGFTAEVGGATGATDDADEARDAAVPASARGPVTDGERDEGAPPDGVDEGRVDGKTG